MSRYKISAHQLQISGQRLEISGRRWGGGERVLSSIIYYLVLYTDLKVAEGN